MKRFSWMGAWLVLGLLAGCGAGDGSQGPGARSETDAGGAGGSAGAASCKSAAAFAELTAPDGEGFGEVVIAASDHEVAVAYTLWKETRDVSVFLQRFNLGGVALGPPVLLGSYNAFYGQLAAGDSYGRPSIATDGARHVVCWGEGFSLGCGVVRASTGDASFFAIERVDGGSAYAPRVTHGSSGFRVFYESASGTGSLAVTLDEQARPVGAPAPVPGSLAVATSEGYLVASPGGQEVSRLGPDLTLLGDATRLSLGVDSLVWLDGVVGAIGVELVTLLDADGHTTSVALDNVLGRNRTAVAPRGGAAGVVWASPDNTLRFRAIDAAGQAAPVEDLGCIDHPSRPAIAPVQDGFLVVALRPEGGREIFYSKVYPKLWLTLVKRA